MLFVFFLARLWLTKSSIFALSLFSGFTAWIAHVGGGQSGWGGHWKHMSHFVHNRSFDDATHGSRLVVRGPWWTRICSVIFSKNWLRLWRWSRPWLDRGRDLDLSWVVSVQSIWFWQCDLFRLLCSGCRWRPWVWWWWLEPQRMNPPGYFFGRPFYNTWGAHTHLSDKRWQPSMPSKLKVLFEVDYSWFFSLLSSKHHFYWSEK